LACIIDFAKTLSNPKNISRLFEQKLWKQHHQKKLKLNHFPRRYKKFFTALHAYFCSQSDPGSLVYDLKEHCCDVASKTTLGIHHVQFWVLIMGGHSS
jgi:hypothetical protein